MNNIEKKDANSLGGGQKRIVYIDILNIAACIAVIFLHMNGFAHHYAPNSLWKSSLVFECIFYWAVPIFLMISGANLLDYRKRYDTKTFFKKRFTKILIPWIFWSFLTYLVLFKNLNIINFISKFLSGDIV